MALLQSQMTRYHEDLKPRFSNPTYCSTNIGSSIGMYDPYIRRNFEHKYQTGMVRSNSIQQTQKPSSKGLEKPSSRQLPYPSEPLITHRRSSSQLSNVGSNSLKSLNRFISDREVFQKQQKNYNIISVQPNEFQPTIKMFPKYHLEDQDHNYFRKMQLQKDLSSKMTVNREMMKRGNANLEHSHNPEAKPMRGKYLNHVDEVADII